MAKSVNVTKSKIVVTRVFKNEFQKAGTLTAELKQIHTTTSSYDGARVDNNMQQNIFSAADCGFTPKTYTSPETRMAWIPVPEGSTLESVQAKIDELPEATIYRVLASEPVLTADQSYAIGQGLRTKDQYADSQAARYPETAGANANKLLLKDGKPFYRRTFFWKTEQVDQDMRDASKSYVSAKMKAEIEGASVLEGQTL